MRKPISCGILLSLLSLVCIPTFGQQTGEIRGIVTDDAKSPLPGVAIAAKSPNLQGLRTAVTDDKGQFRLPLLPVGQYALNFEFPGFEKLAIIGQDVRLGFTVSLSAVLKPAAVTEEVTVTAPAPLIDKTKADNSYRLNSDELARVPTQARTIAEVVGLTPGVTNVRANSVTGGANAPAGTETGGPSFRGEGDAGNNWLVDGLSSKGAVMNDPGTRINYDSWDEVQIVSDGFAPEMGQALGGFINIVTKSGGNEFHGELGALVRDKNFRARRQEQLSVATLPETSLSQFFGNLGGPILKDKLWFFLSNNYFGNVDQTTERSIGWLTIPSGNRRVGTNNAFGKLTFTPHKNHTFSLSGTLDKSINQSGGIGVPETYTKETYTDYFYRLNYRGILSQNTLLTAALGQNRRKQQGAPLSGDYGPPSYNWLDISQVTNNAVSGWLDTIGRTDMALGLTHYLDLGRWGNHEIKVGGSYFAVSLERNIWFTGLDSDPWPGNGFDNGVLIDWAAPGNPLALSEMGIAKQKNTTHGFGFYAQDDITLGRFSLMLGLRTDTQRVFNNLGELGWGWGPGDFLQPRASLAVDLSGDGRNVLKLGYGRFAMSISLLPLSNINTNILTPYRYYGWAGGENPTDSQLKEATNWDFIIEGSTASVPYEVDPELKPNKTDKFFVEFDRRLGTNWAVKVRGIYSYSHTLLEDIALYAPESPQGFTYLFTNFELKKRNYKAFEIEMNGRIAGRLTLNASWTWSQAKGTVPGNMFETTVFGSGWGGWYDSSAFGDHPNVPEGSPDKEFFDGLFHGLGGRGIGDEGWYGILPYSVDHVVKILGTYFAPFGIVVSTNLEYLSGYHWEKKGFSEAYGDFFTFPEGRGGRMTPAHVYFDIMAEKDFRLKNGMALAMGINAYNVLNSQRPVSYAKQDNELFGQVWARQLPRWVQFKMTLRF